MGLFMVRDYSDYISGLLKNLAARSLSANHSRALAVVHEFQLLMMSMNKCIADAAVAHPGGGHQGFAPPSPNSAHPHSYMVVPPPPQRRRLLLQLTPKMDRSLK
jgi:hypothetical protein